MITFCSAFGLFTSAPFVCFQGGWKPGGGPQGPWNARLWKWKSKISNARHCRIDAHNYMYYIFHSFHLQFCTEKNIKQWRISTQHVQINVAGTSTSGGFWVNQVSICCASFWLSMRLKPAALSAETVAIELSGVPFIWGMLWELGSHQSRLVWQSISWKWNLLFNGFLVLPSWFCQMQDGTVRVELLFSLTVKLPY